MQQWLEARDTDTMRFNSSVRVEDANSVGFDSSVGVDKTGLLIYAILEAEDPKKEVVKFVDTLTFSLLLIAKPIYQLKWRKATPSMFYYYFSGCERNIPLPPS